MGIVLAGVRVDCSGTVLYSVLMILHTVAFKTKHPQSYAEESAFLKAGMALGDLPMVHHFQCFKQVSPKNDFEFGVPMEFDSEEECDAYNIHPVHMKFVETRLSNRSIVIKNIPNPQETYKLLQDLALRA